MLKSSQMIYIPKNAGLTQIVVDQIRVVYVNNFEFGKYPDFMNGADNITSIRQIQDMAIGPMIGH